MDGFGLMDYNARYYDPLLGRFISPDSIIPQPGSPLAWEWYAYTSNSPVNYGDPTDHAQACMEGDEGGRCGRGSNTEEIYLAIDDEHGGMNDGLFAEYYAKHHKVTLAKAKEDPNLPEYEASAYVSYQYIIAWIPQHDFNPDGYPSLDSRPGQEFEWRGSSSTPGSPEGRWYNPNIKEYLRVDLNHHGTQHIDYRAPDGNEYWIWPDGSMTQK